MPETKHPLHSPVLPSHIRKDTGPGIDIIRLMSRYVHAVKTDFRQFDRPLRGIGAIHFHYR